MREVEFTLIFLVGWTTLRVHFELSIVFSTNHLRVPYGSLTGPLRVPYGSHTGPLWVPYGSLTGPLRGPLTGPLTGPTIMVPPPTYGSTNGSHTGPVTGPLTSERHALKGATNSDLVHPRERGLITNY